MIVIKLPLRIVSEANAHGHWRQRQGRAKMQRRTAWLYVNNEFNARHTEGRRYPIVPPNVCVEMVRIGPRRLDDDNLQSGFKAVRDGVADAFGVDDGGGMIQWRYTQRQGERGEYGCEIRISQRRASQSRGN